MIDWICKFIHDSWINILEFYYFMVLNFGTLLLAFYVAVKDRKALRILVEMLTIWLILEGVNSQL